VEQQRVDPATRVFVDEFGINLDLTRRYARAPRGTRAVGSVPGSTRGNITLVFGLGAKAVLAPRLLRKRPARTIFQDRVGVPSFAA
jgi:hypothetical protein